MMTDEELAAALREAARGSIRTLAAVAARRLLELASEVARLQGSTGVQGHPSSAAPDRWLNVHEAAVYLKMKAAGVRALVQRGELRPDGAGSKRVHMFRARTLDALLEARANRREPVASAAAKSKPTAPVPGKRPSTVPRASLRALVKQWEAEHASPATRDAREPRPKATKTKRAEARAGMKNWLAEKREKP